MRHYFRRMIWWLDDLADWGSVIGCTLSIICMLAMYAFFACVVACVLHALKIK